MSVTSWSLGLLLTFILEIHHIQKEREESREVAGVKEEEREEQWNSSAGRCEHFST